MAEFFRKTSMFEQTVYKNVYWKSFDQEFNFLEFGFVKISSDVLIHLNLFVFFVKRGQKGIA